MRANIIKRAMLTLVIGMMFMGMTTSLPVNAASVRKLSASSKKLSVGQEYTVKLKGLSKKDKKSKKTVLWSISDKRTVVFKQKGKYFVKVRARQSGTAKVTGIYRGKKYICKITVGSTQNIEDEEDSNSGEDASSGKTDCKLNASDVTIYPDTSPVVPLGEAVSTEFTSRELEILRELTAGGSNAEIAEKFHISERTVKMHITNMLQKTGFRSRLELAVQARTGGIVIPDS